MNTTNTFAADIKNALTAWDAIVEAAAKSWPNDTEEQRFQRCSAKFTEMLNTK